MELEDAADCLEKLGNPTRLQVFRLLVRAGHDGLPVGQIQEHLGVPGSTLSHHLSHLVHAGLIRQTREGRVLRCRPNFELMDQVIAFLFACTQTCLKGVECFVCLDEFSWYRIGSYFVALIKRLEFVSEPPDGIQYQQMPNDVHARADR